MKINLKLVELNHNKKIYNETHKLYAKSASINAKYLTQKKKHVSRPIQLQTLQTQTISICIQKHKNHPISN